MKEPKEYYLYIDECGDPCLATYDRNFPIFTLCGVLVPAKQNKALERAVNALKQDFWQTTDVILHSRDIRKCEKDFQILFDNNVKQKFYTVINEILKPQGAYFIACCCVLKNECIRRYGISDDIYGTALKYVLQRSIFCVDDIDAEGGRINIVVERRGKKEDTALLKYYNGLRVTGMHYVSPERFSNHIADFTFAAKSNNIIGLQIADLIAYPISRHLISAGQPNAAYDVIANNIYCSNGNLLGLKIYPDK